jgi:lipopolysaccharide export system permease protein
LQIADLVNGPTPNPQSGIKNLKYTCLIKKLDILITKAFVGPFVATFVVTLLVLLMQFFWLWIDDFVGKGLSTSIILEFTWYQLATLVPLALPLAVLLSSLMTFGNLGESFELVAIRSAGISLLRFMRPLFLITILLCVLAFLFANNFMPVAQLKSKTLLRDIYNKQPAFELQEGVFYNKIPGFAIKVGRKEKDSLISDVIIYERGGPLQDNFIVAKNGVMRLTENGLYLEMILKDGWRYEERGDRYQPTSDYIRLGFKEYKKQFDLSSVNEFTRTADSVFRSNEQMLNMKQLDIAMDSIQKEMKNYEARVKLDASSYFPFVKTVDSGWKKSDSRMPAIKSFNEIIPDSMQQLAAQKASTLALSVKTNNDMLFSEWEARKRALRLHEIEWHNKISLSVACLVLFLIGAPLGSIIRKGGFGSPMILAIIFFLVFYFVSNTGRKFAKEGAMSPFAGMWLATFVLVPIGIFLVVKAMNDSQLFNKEFYFRLRNKFRKLFGKKDDGQLVKDDGQLVHEIK